MRRHVPIWLFTFTVTLLTAINFTSTRWSPISATGLKDTELITQSSWPTATVEQFHDGIVSNTLRRSSNRQDHGLQICGMMGSNPPRRASVSSSIGSLAQMVRALAC